MGRSSTTEVADLDIERLVRIDQQIDANESTALRARWEFGQQMLAARDGAGRLPNGYLTRLVERTGKSRTELKYRAIFASSCPTEGQLVNALTNSPSWFELTKSLKATKDADDSLPVKPPAAVEGKFRTFIADPPWQYGNTSTRGNAAKEYATLSTDEICGLTVVPDHAEENAHLYLWVTSSHLPDGLKVMEEWGFQYKTYLVWVKPQIGMGNYFRVSTELVLFGVRGSLRTQARDIKNYFTVDRGKHSQKPDQFRDLVARASEGPYMELFSRCWREQTIECVCPKCARGWTVWGNQS